MSPPLPLLLLLLILLPSAAAATAYIVLTQPTLQPTRFPNPQAWYSSTLQQLSQQQEDQHQHPPSGGPTILHTYTNALHGFAAALTADQASALESRPFVLAVLPDRAHKLHTTRSPAFLGLGGRNSRLLADSDAGGDVVIAVLDSGIDPGHRSFGDDGIGPVPARWNGTCEFGPRFGPGSCNRKLIGAKSFPAGFKVEVTWILRSVSASVWIIINTEPSIQGHTLLFSKLWEFSRVTPTFFPPKNFLFV